jgi:hypothetical protein
MVNARTFLLSFLLLATTVLGAGNMCFSSRYKNVLDPDNGVAENRFAMYDDHKAQEVLNNMNTWSNGKYVANKNARTGIITVKMAVKTIFDTKNEAITNNEEMQQVVTDHYTGPTT